MVRTVFAFCHIGIYQEIYHEMEIFNNAKMLNQAGYNISAFRYSRSKWKTNLQCDNNRELKVVSVFYSMSNSSFKGTDPLRLVSTGQCEVWTVAKIAQVSIITKPKQ